MKRNYLPLFIVLFVLIGLLDQVTKIWAVYRLGFHNTNDFGTFAYNYIFNLGQVGIDGFPFVNPLFYKTNLEVIPKWFSFYLMLNDGAAWSILSGKPILLAMISMIMMVLFGSLWFIKYQHNLVMTFGFGMMIGGALGNFIDRWRLNVVVDFLRFTLPEDILKFPLLNDFPIFNLADAFAVSGILLIGLHLLLIELDKERKQSKKEASNKIKSLSSAPATKSSAEPISSAPDLSIDPPASQELIDEVVPEDGRAAPVEPIETASDSNKE